MMIVILRLIRLPVTTRSSMICCPIYETPLKYHTTARRDTPLQLQQHLHKCSNSLYHQNRTKIFVRFLSARLPIRAKSAGDKSKTIPPPSTINESTKISEANERLKNESEALSTTKDRIDQISKTGDAGESLQQQNEKAKQSDARNLLQSPPSSGKTKYSREAVRQNVQGYLFTRYFDYVKNYDKVLEKNFPAAFKLYRVFFDGLKDFFADMKLYLKIWRITITSIQSIRALNRKELELYMQMPRDMLKIAPALIGTSLPMVGYAFFPLIFMYPRTWLTSHFWTLQQRSEFSQLQLKDRLSYNRPVFRCLQAKLSSTKSEPLHSEFTHILGLIGSGLHPSAEALLEVKEVFAKKPYNFSSLSGKHIKLLCALHDVPGRFDRRHRLRDHAFLVHYMDLAITREGGVHNMNIEAIRKSCLIRGLNPANLNNDEMINWLREWIKVSTSVQEEHLSLFLHLPIFLGYNHPNNWQLIYGGTTSNH